MSTRILFADDSVTAQNMGKRILTEAGYEVVAVSNGAAAVKKIAEQKPDIIILDLYMPGYSGLEVCEKVRGSMATLKTPVLLTVGKMEPYRPEDANRVRADGVIVKPFEASDLLAIIKKFEERIVPAPPPLAQPAEPEEEEHTVLLESPLEAQGPVTTSTAQPTVDVPDHMASSSAFADLLGMEPPATLTERPSIPFESSAVASQPSHTPHPRASVPEYELPVAWKEEEQAKKNEIELPPPVASAVEPPQHDVQVFEAAATRQQAVHQNNDVAPPPAPSHPLQIPVYQESAEAAQTAETETHEFMPTSTPAIGEIEIPREPFLQENAADTTRSTVATSTEPGLISGLQPVTEPESAAQLEAAELASVDPLFVAGRSHEIQVPVQTSEEPAALGERPPALSDADFEARVAAALAAYGPADAAPAAAASTNSVHAAPKNEHFEPPVVPAAEPQESLSASAPIEQEVESRPVEMASTTAAEPEPAVSEFEYRPPIGFSHPQRESAEAIPQAAEPRVDLPVIHRPEVASFSPTEPVATTPDPPAGQPIAIHNDLDAGMESAAQSLAEAAAEKSHADRHTIAQAVHRVMEKLKPELVDEILRELKSKD